MSLLTPLLPLVAAILTKVPLSIIVGLPTTTLITTLITTTLATLATYSSATPIFLSLFPFTPHLRTIIFMNGGFKQLMSLTLYDFYYHQHSVNNTINSNSNYIFVLHDEFIPLDIFIPNTLTSFDILVHLDDNDETDFDHIPLWVPLVGPLHLDLELSNVDDPL